MLGAHILFLDNSGYSTAFNLGCQIPIAGQECEASREWPVKVARGRAVHRVMAPRLLRLQHLSDFPWCCWRCAAAL